MGLGLTGAHMGCRRFGSCLDLLEFCKIFGRVCRIVIFNSCALNKAVSLES